MLTTLQCNFACDYCFQGDHGDYNKFAAKMSLDTARKVALWIEQRLDEVRPEKFHLTLFGGEPLLNLPVAYYLAERTHAMCEERGVPQSVSVITNGLLLTPEVVDRLLLRTVSSASRSRSTATATRTTGCVRCADGRARSTASSRTSAASRQGSDHDRRQLRREQLGQLSGAAGVPEAAGVRRPDRQDQLQADHQGARAEARKGSSRSPSSARTTSRSPERA